jgi:hypothetical protein
MGWYYTYGATKPKIIAEITAPMASACYGSRETLKKCVRGNVLWVLHKTTNPAGEVTKWIGCYLLGAAHGSSRDNPEWGYKPMDEDMHPYYYSCPASILDEADPPRTESSMKWRALCREHAAKQSRALKVGQWYALPGRQPNAVWVSSISPLRGVSAGGLTFKLARRMIGDEIAPPEGAAVYAQRSTQNANASV